jgi:hypothetical protein
MIEYFWYTLVAIVIFSYWINVTKILPEVSKHKTLNIRAWIFSGPHQIKALLYYKDICRRENRLLFWFNSQIFLGVSFISISLIAIFGTFVFKN